MLSKSCCKKIWDWWTKTKQLKTCYRPEHHCSLVVLSHVEDEDMEGSRLGAALTHTAVTHVNVTESRCIVVHSWIHKDMKLLQTCVLNNKTKYYVRFFSTFFPLFQEKNIFNFISSIINCIACKNKTLHNNVIRLKNNTKLKIINIQ
jgi:hypothetical protein